MRGKAKTSAGDAVLLERLAATERELATMRAERDRLVARTRLLEENQAEARDRIAWALDTLHNILDGKA